MKRIWMTGMLVAAITGIGLIPVTVHAGSAYNRPDPEGRRYYVSPVTPYPSSGYVGGYAREEPQPVYRSPDVYESVPAPYPKPCVKSARVKPHRSETMKTTVIVNYPKPALVKPCLTPRKVERHCTDSCPNPCFNEIRRTSRELREMVKENKGLRERAQTDSVERQKLAEENATWRERARNREAWIEDYRAKYIKNNGWR